MAIHPEAGILEIDLSGPRRMLSPQVVDQAVLDFHDG